MGAAAALLKTSDRFGEMASAKNGELNFGYGTDFEADFRVASVFSR